MRKKEIFSGKRLSKELGILFSDLVKSFKEPRIRVLSDSEKKSISKETLDYLLSLRKKHYISEENFEKIIFMTTIVSNMTGQRGDFYVVEDVLELMFFAESGGDIIPDIIDNMMTGMWNYFKQEDIN